MGEVARSTRFASFAVMADADCEAAEMDFRPHDFLADQWLCVPTADHSPCKFDQGSPLVCDLGEGPAIAALQSLHQVTHF